MNLQSARKTGLDSAAARVRRRRWIVVCGLLGVTVSLAVFAILRQREYQAAETRFRLNARQRADVTKHVVRDQLAIVRALAAFYAGSQEVERSEFHEFSSTLLADYRGAESLAWAPHVIAANRAAQEQVARAEGVPDYQIRDRSATATLIPAADRDEYFPVFYFEGKPSATSVLGFDLGTLPDGPALFHRSAAARQLVVGAAAPWLTNTPGVTLLAVTPVFNNPLDKSRDTAPRGQLDGFAVGLFSVPKALDEPLELIEPDGIDTYLFLQADDVASARNAAAQCVYVKPSVLRDEALVPREKLPEDTSLLCFRNEFTLGDRNWTVYCEPIASYVAGRRTMLPWATLLAGLVLTGLMVGYLALLTRRTTDVEGLVSRREAELETISSTALDAVIMMDPNGHVAQWNEAAERIFGYRRDEILGRSIHETIVPAQRRKEAHERIRSFSVDGRGPNVGRLVEMNALRRDGSEFPIEMSIAPLRASDGWWAVAIVRDITKRKLIEESLKRERRGLRQMVNLQERDRQLVSYEIHDGLAQQLAGAMMKFQAVRAALPHDDAATASVFDEAERSLTDALAEARRLISGLRPPVLDEAGVVAAIEYLIGEHQQRGCPNISFSHQVRFERLATPLEITLFRVVQEALTNACRYSQSERIEVTLTQPNGKVRVEVRDFGVGFDPAAVETGRYGVQGMRERARLMGGSAEIIAAPGKGVCVRVELPVIDEDLAEDEE